MKLEHKMESLELLTTQQAADYLGVAVYWLQTHWKSEGIPVTRLTPKGPLRFRRSSLEAWAKSREVVYIDPGISERQKKSRKVSLV
jgi:hypothetical protein